MPASFIEQALLNPAQKEAAVTVDGPLLVLAGAGSGKTRVLTHRVAHMLLDLHISPYHILAITFTNKATKEMKERISHMCGELGERVWVSTFHSACARILRRDIHNLGYTRDFTIYDDDDCLKLITRLMEKRNVNIKQVAPKFVRAAISGFKNDFALISELEALHKGNPMMETAVAVYKDYEAELKKNNSLDFDDLIHKTLQLFHEHPAVLADYQERFRYILVDEYQDTNHSQYLLVRLLAARHKNLCVVGDDDQSIYGWRGADVSNILDFEKDFKNTKVVKLEQNYRSTETILNAANAVIDNNTTRKKKKLWSKNGAGAPICRAVLPTDREEAMFVARRIAAYSQEGLRYADMAILYRTNATSRIFEDVLIAGGIPYRMYGGQRFYDRKEVKDAIAYLKLVVNPSDEVALRRVINVPKRGIGEASVAQLAEIAAQNGESLLGVIMEPEVYRLPARLAAKLSGFAELIVNLVEQNQLLAPDELVKYMLEKTGLVKQYEEEATAEAEGRIENLLEMQNAAAEFRQQNPEGVLGEYLENVALVSEAEKDMSYENARGSVSLMTIHSAKGLEFPAVFLVAMEEGIFPLSRAMMNLSELEEERRLCYVGITRAKQHLHITGAENRMLYGEQRRCLPSRFVEEIPPQYLKEEERARPAYRAAGTKERPPATLHMGMGSVPAPRPAASGQVPQPFRPGDKIRHRNFGEGTVVAAKGTGRDLQVDIAFPGQGVKTFSAAFAPIEKIV